MGGVRFYGKKHYEGVRFNVICVMRGWVVQFSEKKCYVTLEWPLWFKVVRVTWRWGGGSNLQKKVVGPT